MSAGLLAAVALALLSYANVSFAGGSPSLTYKDPQIWSSSSKIFITQKGLPWGRASFPIESVETPTGGAFVPKFADPSRFSGLAILYSQLANSDIVQMEIRKRKPPAGSVVAQPVAASDSSSAQILPIITITGTSTDPADARTLAQIGTDEFISYTRREQARANIAETERVEMQVLNQPLAAQLVQDRRKTLPIVVFLSLFCVTVGLAFVLENMRPAAPAVSEAPRRLSA